MARTKEYIANTKRQWYLRNREQLLAKANENYQKNKEKKLEKKKDTYEKNREKYKARMRADYQKNPAPHIERARLRAGVMEQQTPKWLTKKQREEMNLFYINRPQGFHVDHIVPLKGKTVSGLHVPWNLQYLPAVDNLRKGNKHESD